METKVKKISLVTSCFNHRDYIAETIESVLSQNYPDLQYVVIDDGSTDGSWEVIKKYKDRLYYCERLEGYRDTPTIALNYGFSKTDGEVMGWLNSDDILLPKSLFTISDAFTDNPDVKWMTGMASTINSGSRLINSKLRLKNKYDYLIGDWKVIQQESTFWLRDLWQASGARLNGEQKWAFDTELWTKFFVKAEHYHLSAPLGAFRKGQQSKSVSEKQSFLGPNDFYLDRMKDSTLGFDRMNTFLYFICKKITRPFWALIPNRIFKNLPYFNRFCYKVLEYVSEDKKWIIRVVNPFKFNRS